MILTKEEFKIVYELIAVNYTIIEVSPLTPKLHYKYFKEIPVENFKVAILRVIEESELYPSVATIKKYLREAAGIPTLEEVYDNIYKIMKICRKGSWSKKDYPDIVGRIIDECGYISGISLLSNDEFLSKIKGKYYNIVEEIKKEQDIKNQLLPGKPVAVR